MTSPPFASAALVRLLAVAAGAAVANSYYNQAMLGHIGRDFAISAAGVAAIPVVTQLGNAIGVLFLAPLGDRLERRSLMLFTIGALVLALLAAAASQSFAALAVASVAIGGFATVAQQIVPFAVTIATDDRRGRVLGTVTGGILLGILLARVFSGIASDLWGWRLVFLVAAGVMAAIGGLLAALLPRIQPTTALTYGRLLASLWHLVAAHPVLRRATLIQCLVFMGFIGFWSSLALALEAPPYRLGASAVALLALVGAAGALAAPLAGRFADRAGSRRVVTIGTGLATASFVLLVLGQGSMAVMVTGTLLLDLAVQTSQVANQTQVYALDRAARSRLNTVFMAAMLLSGSLGAGLGGLAFATWGWSGTCLFGALSSLLALILSLRPPP
ncbi:MFS transporter [Kaistia geumhonensis]|uniref:MFS family arabinose efflux permease n=1 Tax=Kaistia geumhonensis TaxID=410839 RepID=A0ABU0M3W6_9HYPH|nr:MFS transporter [Kaistia geumhonensis]MCX5479153.1 MFS transporter [Kaistia geumhonensis]MDQ0515627.1 putative MFS family arabinose efflux permease [Kaistia geumhonensis]